LIVARQHRTDDVPGGTRRMIRPVLLAGAALVALTCAYTWPLAAHLGSTVAHDRGDPLLVTWILWWNTQVVPLTSAWWNAPAFYPSPGVLAFSENLLGLAPITGPVIALTHTPVLGYNAAFLASYVLSGLGAYFLGFVLTRRHDASMVAAVAFAFAPYRLSHTQHLQLLSSYWMPVAIAALHLYLASPRWRWASLFAVSWLLQALACGYYLFFLTILVALWLCWFAPRRLAVRDGVRLGAAWAAAGLAIAPVLLGYRAIHAAYGFTRSPVEVVNYSADVAGLWSASGDSLVWSWVHACVGAESELFPGLTVLLLLVVGVATMFARQGTALAEDRTRGTGAFYALSAGLMWVLSLGPRPALHAQPLGVYGPYALLMNLPGFNGMRVPARLWMVSLLCLAMVSALVVSRIDSRGWRRFAVAAAVAGMLLDGWPRVFALAGAAPMRVTTIDARARLGLPLAQNETETMYGAIAQGRPVFNGYSGYTAPQHAAMRDLLEHYDPRILSRLAATSTIEIVIESANDVDGGWRRYVGAVPGARRVDVSPEWTSYALAPTGASAPPPITGTLLPVRAISTNTNVPDINAVLDGDVRTRWHSTGQHGTEAITLDLGGPRSVAAIEMWLGAYPGQYPRAVVVESSSDGERWTEAFSGGTALETYDAAVRAPREVPVTFSIGRHDVRYVRLRQTATDARTGWSIVELRVIQ
jgi:hypothetical protein